MTPLFNKLNLGEHREIQVLNAPGSFDPELKALRGITVQRSVHKPLAFGMAFAITQSELDRFAGQMTQAAEGDAVLWFAYPKGSSKRYRCEFNRDSGWGVLGKAGFEPVRQVSIDEDWSALRFRRAAYISKLTRNPAALISAAGRKKRKS